MFALVTDGRYGERARPPAQPASTPTSSSARPAEIRSTWSPRPPAAPVRRRGRPPQPRGRTDLEDLTWRPDDGTIAGCGGSRTTASWPASTRRRDRRRRARPSRADARRRPTEADVRDELDHRMRRLGADGRATTRSWRAARSTRRGRTTRRSAHDRRGRHRDHRRRRPRRRLPLRHDPHVRGRRADDEQQRDIYDLVRTAQLAGLAAVGAGRADGDVDAACRHGVRRGRATATGSCTAPATASASTSTRTRSPMAGVDRRAGRGDVVTVEPGLYRGGFGGVRIEDLVTVTADGLPEPHPPVQGLAMPAITTNDLKNGITLNLDNGLFQVVEFQHVKPGKGGAFVRTKLRNVRTGERARADVQRRHPGRAGDRRSPGHAVPLPRRRRLRVHEHVDVRPARLSRRRRSATAADYLVEQAVAQIAQYQGRSSASRSRRRWS